VGIEVIKATQDLKICPLVISVPKLQPLNFTFLFKVLKDIQTLITVEEHFVEGGLGSIIADWLSREKLPFKLKKLGIKNEFIHAIKNNAGMRQYYRISADQIKDTIREAFSHG
jgi:transketolase